MEKNWDGKERRSEGISIPYPLLGIMFTLIIQTLGGVWWASAMNAKMEYLNLGQKNMEAAISTAAVNRYTSSDAARDWAANDRRLTIIENSIAENKRVITKLEISNGKKNDN